MDTSLLSLQPGEQDREAVLKSLAGQAASQIQAESAGQYMEEGTIGTETGMSEVEEVRIEQIEIGGDYGDSE